MTAPQFTHPDARPSRGRAAQSNQSGRFEAHRNEYMHDGWQLEEEQDLRGEQQIATEIMIDTSRTILASNKSPDIPFDRSVNPYRGCEHGCIYCYARPGHSYWGYSAGLDFETKLFAKPDAGALLRDAFAKPGYMPKSMAIGANTDAYQPIEKEWQLTRQILEVCAEFQHPCFILSKSALITRDLDILSPMAARGLVHVGISVTSLDAGLSRRMEPRAATPTRRLETIRTLADAGVPVTVMASPMIPGLNDQELDAILAAAQGAGATRATMILLRLPLEVEGLFLEWLQAEYPDRAQKVEKLMRQCRDGKMYQAGFGKRMQGSGPYAALLGQRFQKACQRLSLSTTAWQQDISQFKRPPQAGDQISLFG